jgi:hypothetical protein
MLFGNRARGKCQGSSRLRISIKCWPHDGTGRALREPYCNPEEDPMEATFDHPLWISSGLLLMLAGFWLFRWANRNSATGEIANATKEVALNKLLKGSQGREASPASKNLPAHNFRRAMSQLFGIIGFLLIIVGLMSLLLGIFYPVG